MAFLEGDFSAGDIHQGQVGVAGVGLDPPGVALFKCYRSYSLGYYFPSLESIDPRSRFSQLRKSYVSLASKLKPKWNLHELALLGVKLM
jgi:hypothetical protein